MKTKTRRSWAPSKGADPDIYPLLLEPVYKDYIWGGTRIPEMFRRSSHPEICAESWEVSDRPEGMSIVLNGRHAGKTLHELVTTMAGDLLGDEESDVFPLLIKIIDARERLSVQVHPNDKTAAKYGGEAKTEMWYMLAPEPGAKVFAGLAQGVNRASFERALADERLEDVLQPVPAVAGTSILIPGGRVHAVGAGNVILEVQQNSNTTYRVYDWGRVGHNGVPRELHIKEAFQCINWRDRQAPSVALVRLPGSGSNAWWEVMKSPYFHVTRVDLEESERVQHDGASFNVLFALDGDVSIGCGDLAESIDPGLHV